MDESIASLIDRAGLDKAKVAGIIKRGLDGADDGELFLEYSQAEMLVFDNGRLKQATYDTSQGFGLRAVKDEAVGYAHASDLSEAALARAAEAVRAVKGVAPPILLIVAVLGSIMGGIAAPTEAASMGALGALLIVLVSRKLNLQVLRETMKTTINVNSMIMLILFGSRTFSITFRGLNGDDLIDRMLSSIPGGFWGTIIFLMGVLFLLGFFMEWIEICYIVLPLFLPFFVRQHTDMVWLATVICANLQTSFLTPPFGWALFFIKGVAPPEVTTGDIYRGVIPFIAVQLIGLALLMAFPQISLWLPTAIGWIK